MLTVKSRFPDNPLGRRPIRVGLSLIHGPHTLGGNVGVDNPLLHKSEVPSNVFLIPRLGPDTGEWG
jgi:hypothetical protein